ncbi:MAG: hypothetical protein ABJD11_01515 [Gemmatimonadota bacterium]
MTMSPGTSAIDGNVHFLRQGIALIESIPDELYHRSRPGWSAVGAQFRHVLDHYLCLLVGLEAGQVDYDRRGRDNLTERSRTIAIAMAEQVITGLSTLDQWALQRALEVHMNSGGGDPAHDWGPSTVNRELLFLSSHTVHHYAVIRLLLAGYGFEANEDLGAAPSTLAHAAQRVAAGAEDSTATFAGR